MRLPPSGLKRDLLLALLFALVAGAFRLPRLGVPNEEIFDEVYHAKSALQYYQGVPPVDWVHPPTSKLLIAVGIASFGYEPWAWRLMPALFACQALFESGDAGEKFGLRIRPALRLKCSRLGLPHGLCDTRRRPGI